MAGAVPFRFGCISLPWSFTLIFFALSTWALATNRFFSAVVRIQTDRGQTVVDTGPYRYIRHPGYLAGIMVAIFFPFMMGSWWSFIPVGIMVIAMIIRTALEDKMLINELPGICGIYSKNALPPASWNLVTKKGVNMSNIPPPLPSSTPPPPPHSPTPPGFIPPPPPPAPQQPEMVRAVVENLDQKTGVFQNKLTAW